MLTEDDVVEAVCQHLQSNGYRIDKRCATTERGIDIVAVNITSGATLLVEAKGETSNRQFSNRFGKPFTGAQCRDHVANAFYTAASMATANPEGGSVAVAFADTSKHRRYVERIRGALGKLGIIVFWVSGDRKVELSDSLEGLTG